MWNKKSSSKILQKKRKLQAHIKHKQKLKNMKSTIDNSSPRYYQFLDTRLKAKQKQKQKNTQIQSNNILLVNKMINIQSQLHVKQAYLKNSLHSELYKKKQKEIDNQNRQLLKKLESVTSYYSTQKIKKSIKNYQRLKTNISHQKMDPIYKLGNNKRASQFFYKRIRPCSAKK